MEYIRVILCEWLPVTVRGLTAYYYDEDGMPYYTIFINAGLSVEMQCAAYDHEIQHIDHNDFHLMIPVCKCQYKNDQKVENKNVHFPEAIPRIVLP